MAPIELQSSEFSTLCGSDSDSVPPSLLEGINVGLGKLHPSLRWKALLALPLSPALPFALHERLYALAFSDLDAELPRPAWTPSPHILQQSNARRLAELMGIAHFSMTTLVTHAGKHRREFWQLLVLELLQIQFTKRPLMVLDVVDDDPEEARYCYGARLNIADSCFRHESRDAPAVVYGTDDSQLFSISYKKLEMYTNRVANGIMQRLDLNCGDAVAILMPMTLQAVVISLALVKAGLSVVGIAESFSAAEIAVRLRLSQSKALFTCGFVRRGQRKLPLYARALQANAPTTIVIHSDALRADELDVKDEVELRDGDLDWKTFLERCSESFESVQVGPEHVSHILFSSGTTSDPKAIPWTHTTPIKAIADAFLLHDVKANDIMCWPTSPGWMMGPWLIYAALGNAACIALYYDAPTTAGFCRFVSTSASTFVGLVPSLVRAWRSTNATDNCNWNAVRRFVSSGEASNEGDSLWLMSRVTGYAPVLEYCGGTEIAGAYIGGCMLQPQVPGMFSTVAPGLELLLLNEKGCPADKGEVALVPPSLGLSQHLLHGDHHAVYFDSMPSSPSGQKLRRHGDELRRVRGAYYQALGRCDDTMNLGGIKVSSLELERVCNSVEGVHETAAVAVSPQNGGGPSQLVIFAVVREPSLTPATLLDTFKNAIKLGLNPLFRPHDVVIIDKLPRTSSNKVMRRVLRDQYKTNNLNPSPSRH